MEASALTRRIQAILEDKKAEHVVVLDVRGKSSVTDYTMIASGSSAPHIRALHEEVQGQLKKEGVPCYRRSGEAGSGWMVLDYVGVIVHLFTPEVRGYYGLETLWDEAPAVTGDVKG